MGEKTLWEPNWVVSDQPTSHGKDGFWMKLRLQVAESEVPPPARVRHFSALKSEPVTAWSPVRIPAFAGQALAAIEERVRTFAAELLGK